MSLFALREHLHLQKLSLSTVKLSKQEFQMIQGLASLVSLSVEPSYEHVRKEVEELEEQAISEGVSTAVGALPNLRKLELFFVNHVDCSQWSSTLTSIEMYSPERWPASLPPSLRELRLTNYDSEMTP